MVALEMRPSSYERASLVRRPWRNETAPQRCATFCFGERRLASAIRLFARPVRTNHARRKHSPRVEILDIGFSEFHHLALSVELVAASVLVEAASEVESSTGFFGDGCNFGDVDGSHESIV